MPMARLGFKLRDRYRWHDSFNEEDNLRKVADKIGNIMEKPMIEEFSIIGKIKDIMLENGALGSLMSGSGSTVFGLFEDEERMEFTCKKLKEITDKVFICKTL